MSEMNIPDWVDARTLEWALGVCAHVDAAALQRAFSPSYRAGAAACGAQFRAALTLARTRLPAMVNGDTP
jgi:hypothetical protein